MSYRICQLDARYMHEPCMNEAKAYMPPLAHKSTKELKHKVFSFIKTPTGIDASCVQYDAHINICGYKHGVIRITSWYASKAYLRFHIHIHIHAFTCLWIIYMRIYSKGYELNILIPLSVTFFVSININLI